MPSDGALWADLIRDLGGLTGLLCGVMTLKDRRARRERKFHRGVSGPVGSRTFAGFLLANDGRTVRLSVEFEESSHTRLLGHDDVECLLLWGSFRAPNEHEAPMAVVRLTRSAEGDAFVATGGAGAGSWRWQGRFHVRDRGNGGAIFPQRTRTIDLVPAPYP